MGKDMEEAGLHAEVLSFNDLKPQLCRCKLQVWHEQGAPNMVTPNISKQSPCTETRQPNSSIGP